MAYSKVPFTYTSGPQVFPTNFALGVLEADHIKVYVDGVVDGLGEPVEYAFTYNPANGDVTVTDALTSGQTGTINRIVPIDSLIADFEAGADVSKRNLVRAVKQTLMAVQEAADGREADSILINQTVDDINAISAGIADNVAQTTADRIAAEAAAAAAVPAAATATAQAATATTQAGLATTANTNAQAAKTAAEAAATNADADATQTALDRIAVAADRATTVAAKDTAVAAQVTASAAATTATTQAGIATTQAGIATTQAALAVNAASAVPGNIIPVGAVMYFAGSAAPSGWLTADGSAVTSLYPELRAYLIAAGSPFGTSGSDPRLPNLLNSGIAPKGQPDAIIEDQQASGVAGPVPPFGPGIYGTRRLNTIVHNVDNAVSLASNEFVFDTAGLVQWSFVQRDASMGRLYNVTDAQVVGYSMSVSQGTGGGHGLERSGAARVIAGKTYRLEFTGGTLGAPAVSAGGEVYARIVYFRDVPKYHVARVPCVKAFGQIDIVGMASLSALLTSIATQAEAEAGTDNTKLMTPLRVRQSIDAAPNWDFAPANIALVFSTFTTIAHGLGVMPSEFEIWVQCITADAPYAVGERVRVQSDNDTSTSGITVSADSTNLYIRTGSRLLLQNNAGSFITATAARWQIVIRANR